MHLLNLFIVAVIGTLLTRCTFDIARTRSVLPPVSYSSPSRASLERLTIHRIAIEDSAADRIARFSRTNSPWGSRWVACAPADTMRPGPWTTRLYVVDATDRCQCIEIEARDHASYGVTCEWLNDKALFVRCWWGRIVSTDFVLDTQTARPVYIQDADYSRVTLPAE
jgi:hypothetical protein